MRRYAQSLTDAQIPFDWLDADELHYRFPQFTLQKDVVAFYQEKTGIADPSRGNACHIASARLRGAMISAENPVHRINDRDGELIVKSEKGTFTCRHPIL